MYGTIFNLRVKAGHERDLLELTNQPASEIKGAVAWFLMKPDWFFINHNTKILICDTGNGDRQFT